MKKINFKGDIEDIRWGCGSADITKWHLEHPTHATAPAIYEWYMFEFLINGGDRMELICNHRTRLRNKKKKELESGVVFDTKKNFFYRFWEELLDTAEEEVLRCDED